MEKIIYQITSKLIGIIFEVITDPASINDLSIEEIDLRKKKIKQGIISALALFVIMAIFITTKLFNKAPSVVNINQPNIIHQNDFDFHFIDEVNNSYFDLIKFEDNFELVKGNLGSYYMVDILIDINNSKKKSTFYFDKGEYIIDSEEKLINFKNSLKEFVNFLSTDERISNNKYSIFIKGKADKLKFTKPHTMKHPYIYNGVSYMKHIGNSIFDPRRIIYHRFNNYTYTNQDLPYLRSKFLQFHLSQYGIASKLKTNILEGKISLNIDQYDRNAEIILYLPYNN